MSEIKLKPCPFCGGEAHKRIAFPVDPDGMEMNMYIVGCKFCDIEFSWLWDEECAIELWNNRPTEEEIREKAIDELVEKISIYGTYDHYGNTIDVFEIAEQMKKGE